MIDILGKNASLETYPEGFFKDRNTLGLNHAAYVFETKRAFSCYPFLIADFLNLHHFSAANIVGIKFSPPNNCYGVDDKGKPNFIEGLTHYIGYNRNNWLTSQHMPEQLRHAVEGDFDFGYMACDTCLHLAIYWCICGGERAIDLFGCNHTPISINGFVPDDPGVDVLAAAKRRTEVTRALISAAKGVGVTINWWKNYEEYSKGVLYYGD